MLVSAVIPTHGRAGELAETLGAIGRLDAGEVGRWGLEVVVVDNASPGGVACPRRLGNGVEVRVVRLPENRGAAGRNDGAEAARGAWVLMLDDDSAPLDERFFAEFAAAPAETACLSGEILLPPAEDGRVRHEAGGLPEVPVGCGMGVRREAFLGAGGYDASFGYYVEEYDLAAKLIAGGRRIEHTLGFRVLHRKVSARRDMNEIVRRLVRNNLVVAHRWAPESAREELIAEIVDRYARVAEREGAQRGYAEGLEQGAWAVRSERRTPLGIDEYERFTGLAAAVEHLGAVFGSRPDATAHVLPPNGAPGKNPGQIREALRRVGVRTVDDAEAAQVLVAGTLAPGPAVDAVAAAREAWPGREVLAPFGLGRSEGASGRSGGDPARTADEVPGADAKTEQVRLRGEHGNLVAERAS